MKKETKDLTLAALFLALALILPFFTGQIPRIGSMLLPMHIPIIFCGLICGWKYGLLTGLLAPLLRSLIFGMPVFYPMAIAMAAELATYGFVSGWLYSHSRWTCLWALIKSMVAAMIAGRIIYGICMLILMGLGGQAYTFQMFITGALINGIPGIILQLVLIPGIMLLLNKTGLIPFSKQKEAAQNV